MSFATLLRLVAALGVLLLFSHLVGSWVRAMDLSAEMVGQIENGMWVGALLYACLLAIPFVPGVEIGIGLLGMFGRDVALLVYGATVWGLTVAYAAGRLIPLSVLEGAAHALRMIRLTATLRHVAGLSQNERMEFLVERVPHGWGAWLLRNRYIALAVLLNIPGNGVIGGGGGIAVMAGLCRLFPAPLFLVTICLAVAPVPALVWFLGESFINVEGY